MDVNNIPARDYQESLLISGKGRLLLLFRHYEKKVRNWISRFFSQVRYYYYYYYCLLISRVRKDDMIFVSSFYNCLRNSFIFFNPSFFLSESELTSASKLTHTELLSLSLPPLSLSYTYIHIVIVYIFGMRCFHWLCFSDWLPHLGCFFHNVSAVWSSDRRIRRPKRYGKNNLDEEVSPKSIINIYTSIYISGCPFLSISLYISSPTTLIPSYVTDSKREIAKTFTVGTRGIQSRGIDVWKSAVSYQESDKSRTKFPFGDTSRHTHTHIHIHTHY